MVLYGKRNGVDGLQVHHHGGEGDNHCRRQTDAVRVCAVIDRRAVLVIGTMLVLLVARIDIFMPVIALGTLDIVMGCCLGGGLVMHLTIPDLARQGFGSIRCHRENEESRDDASDRRVHRLFHVDRNLTADCGPSNAQMHPRG
ncbi:MAG: hypothetical protein ACE5FJ_07935 [Gemmatimonadales bacterium]